ncbi:DNA polymerase III subunit chi [Rhodobacterales bacterium HKCCA1058]|nr:DNA polymerase III subunit chi [Rhodobacterales bacterium HKCCA1058]
MSELWFYHLTRSRLEQVLPMLIERALAQGWRVALRAPDAQSVARMDDLLWAAHPPERFLPHGVEGGVDAELQPILIGTGDLRANRPDYLVAIGGATITPEDCAGLTRAVLVFDGQDEASVTHARNHWRSFAEAGLRLQYWSQASGAWKIEREHPQPSTKD